MWSNTPFEVAIERKLRKELGDAEGQALFAHYVLAKSDLPPVWERIIATEPMLTDHGPRHIQNVLANVERLIDKDDFSGVELYSLAMMVLFHDVGNLFGRKNHEQRIAKIYDEMRAGKNPPSQEKFIVVQGAGSHSGKHKDGSSDTLKDLTPHQLEGRPVRLQEIAAVLRLADELAEGPQRTSDYMWRTHGYDRESHIYHHYAKITSIMIDRGNERIAVTYHFDLRSKDGSLEHITSELEALLRFVYRRVQKLDQERKYARYYSNALAAFKTTQIQMNFWIDGSLQDMSLRPLVMTEKVIPGDTTKELKELDPGYDIPALLTKLLEVPI